MTVCLSPIPDCSHVLVFNAKHEPEDVITDGLVTPGGLAIDVENRLLYVADVEQDQVLVYDADTLKLKRRIGTGGHKHELTTPGDFARPSGVAVDQDGNLYVADTLNNRIEIFDGDGNFISTFGKAGDGPGYFSRPKGVAIDSDDHIWVVDGMQDRVQVFNQRRAVAHQFRRPWTSSRPVSGPGRNHHRQDEPGLYLGNLPRTSATVPLRHRR